MATRNPAKGRRPTDSRQIPERPREGAETGEAERLRRELEAALTAGDHTRALNATVALSALLVGASAPTGKAPANTPAGGASAAPRKRTRGGG
jgi:hypothetical protein